MLKSVKLKLKPNKEQIILLNKHIGATCFVWNRYLNERKEEYRLNKRTLNYYNDAKSLTQLKKQEGLGWLNEINSQTLQSTLKDLDTAYNRFFKKLGNFPRFKSKFRKASFRVPQYVRDYAYHLTNL